MQENKWDLTVEGLSDLEDLRKRLNARADVLDRVKRLFLLPGLEMMTVQQVADHYGVKAETVRRVYASNKDEISKDGVRYLTVSQINKEIPNVIQYKEDNDGITVTLRDGEEVSLADAGNLLFSHRAVLRIGMLLDDGEVVGEVRTQLLNVAGGASDEQKINGLSAEW